MANQSIITEFWEFLKLRKKIWLLPIVLMLLSSSARDHRFYGKQRGCPFLSTPCSNA